MISKEMKFLQKNNGFKELGHNILTLLANQDGTLLQSIEKALDNVRSLKALSSDTKILRLYSRHRQYVDSMLTSDDIDRLFYSSSTDKEYSIKIMLFVVEVILKSFKYKLEM